MIINLLNLCYDSTCLTTEIVSVLDVYAVQICLNIYLSFHLCQMFALSFFQFFLARQVFQGLCLCVCFWLFLRSHNLSMLELVGNFPVKIFFVLFWFFFFN